MTDGLERPPPVPWVEELGFAKKGAAAHSRRWLVRRRIMIPDRVEDFVERTAPLDRFDLTARQLTLLSAPDGFGKTTMLAHSCRQIRKQGGIAAWLSIEEDEDPALLLSYLRLALADAGLEIIAPRDDEGLAEFGVETVLRSIAAHRGPCVVALDEVDRLGSDASLALLNRILQAGPANLHLGMTCRELPGSLEIAPWILDGRGIIVTVEQLRFKKSEANRFLSGKQDSPRIAAWMQATQGWPFALRLQRNLLQFGEMSDQSRKLTLNWMWTRLLRKLSGEDGAFVLDCALLDYADAALFDAVLGPGSAKRLTAIPTLAGLVQPVGNARGFGLHPLLREMCAERLLGESIDRFCEVHRRIAEVLASRGQMLDAMRHAHQARDSDLVARLLENAGGIRLWLRFGIHHLHYANKLLTQRMLDRHPRLVQVRCALLSAYGESDRAMRLYDSADVRARIAARSGDGGNPDLVVDDLILRGQQAMFLCHPLAWSRTRAVTDAYRRLAGDAEIDRLARGVMRYGLAVTEYLQANFEDARRWIGKSQQDLQDTSDYMSMYAGYLEGTLAFANGRPVEATAAYKRSFEIGNRQFVADKGPLISWEVYRGELHLERNQLKWFRDGSLNPEYLGKRGGWLDVFVAAAYVNSELALGRGDGDGALDGLRKGLDFARRTGRISLRRALAAQLAGALVRTGNVVDAQWVWRSEPLPERVEACTELTAQSWREMECICTARAWLLLAEGDIEAARKITDAFARLARNAGLVRSLTWALALSAAVHEQAGDRGRATDRLTEYEKIWLETGYFRAGVAVRDYVAPVLDDLARAASEANGRLPGAELASVLLAVGADVRSAPLPRLTAREGEVLLRLEQAADKEIAAALGISTNGVRYHVKNLFRKLGVRDRRSAVRHAREIGLVGGWSDA